MFSSRSPIVGVDAVAAVNLDVLTRLLFPSRREALSDRLEDEVFGLFAAVLGPSHLDGVLLGVSRHLDLATALLANRVHL